MKKNIAILTGGFSAEKIISFKSADVVEKHLDASLYNAYQIVIEETNWYEKNTKTSIDKNDFSITLNDVKILFDAVFVAIHGEPLEDGKLQGYFDLLSIPYTCCDGFVSALTMSKQHTKTFVKETHIPLATSLLISKKNPINISEIEALGYPLFVKPNKVGSSFGVSKVKETTQLKPALDEAFKHDDEIIIEQFISGREFSNGVFTMNGEVHVLPVTEIISENEFFDYEAKYLGKSKEITPAVLTTDETKRCQEQSLFLYEKLGCKGACRFDYILHGNDFYFLEVNTIPGLSEQSLIPQQANYAGYTLTRFFDILIQESIKSKG